MWFYIYIADPDLFFGGSKNNSSSSTEQQIKQKKFTTQAEADPRC